MSKLEKLIYEPKKLLGITNNLPKFHKAIKNKSDLNLVCSSLYGCKKEEVKGIFFDEEKSSGREIKCYEVTFSNGLESFFYIKKSWEGAITEALGMALANILLKDYYNFVISEDRWNEIIAIEGIKGRSLNDIVRDIFKNNPYTYNDIYKDFFNETLTMNYGIALELANALYLGDRNTFNLILSENDTLINIDFGYLFLRNYDLPRDFLYEIWGDPIPSDNVALKKGRTLGRQIITQNIRKNKDLLNQVFSAAKDRGFLERFDIRWSRRVAKENVLKTYDYDLVKLLESYTSEG